MEKAAKLLTTVLALWLSAATWANGADTFGEPTNYNRAKHITSAKTAKVPLFAGTAPGAIQGGRAVGIQI